MLSGEIDDIPQDNQITIGGKVVNFEHIFQTSGSDQVETKPESGKFINISVSSGKIEIKFSDDSPFFFRAEILSPGEVGMNMVLKDKQGNRNLDMPSGKQLVSEAMKFLDVHNQIDRFTATWKEDSDNFIQFWHSKNINGLSDEEAVFNTWTGENVARKFGFNNIRDIYKDMHSDERFVIVKFFRIPHDV